MCICEICVIACKKNGLNVENGAQELNLENPDFWCPLERGIHAPSIFCRHGARSSGEVDARAGSYVDRPSVRAAEFALEHDFDVTSTFAGPKGPLERGSPRSSRDPVF